MIKKIIFAFVLFSSLSLPVYATGVGIPDYLIPKETPLRNLNTAISNDAKNSIDGQAATRGANLVLQFIANALLYVAAPLAILFVAHGGQNYAFAFGEQGKLDAAKREITWALLGLGTILISYIVIRLVIGAFLGFDKSGTIGTSGATVENNTQISEEQKADEEKWHKYDCVESNQGYIQDRFGKSCIK